MDPRDKKALKYSGLMGHHYNVVVDDDRTERTVCIEADSIESVLRNFPTVGNPTIYYRAKKTWKKIAILERK